MSENIHTRRILVPKEIKYFPEIKPVMERNMSNKLSDRMLSLFLAIDHQDLKAIEKLRFKPSDESELFEYFQTDPGYTAKIYRKISGYVQNLGSMYNREIMEYFYPLLITASKFEPFARITKSSDKSEISEFWDMLRLAPESSLQTTSWTTYLHNIIDHYDKPVKHRELVYRTEKGVYSLSYEKYVWFFYQAVFLNIPTFSEVLLKKNCSNLYVRALRLAKGDDKLYIKYKREIIPLENANNFFTELIQDLEQDEIIILEIIIKRTLDSHQNIGFMRKYRGKIYIFFYEPHGAISDVIKEFLTILERKLPIKIKELHNPIQGKCGYQKKMNDKTGFCVMVSLFWLNCVTLCLSRYPTKFTEIIQNTEKYILEYVGETNDNIEEKMKNIILHFSVEMVDYFLTNFSSRNNDLNFEMLLQKHSGNINKFEPRDKRDNSKYREELDYEYKLHNISHEKSSRRRDGEMCSSDSECLSDICSEKKICVGMDSSEGEEELRRRI